MWTCPNCGEPIDDGVDFCWKCGMARDGSVGNDFQAEPPDPDAPDRAMSDGPEEIAGSSVTAPGDGNRGRIVELCSAGSVFEAQALHGALEEAGIRSRVAGDLLASSLPLGETTTARIWVCEQDVSRAQEVVDAWTRETHQGGSVPDKEEEPAEMEAESDEGAYT